MYYSYPDIKALHNDYLVRYGQEFLSMNNLTVGDHVEIEFSYDIVVTAYGSKQPERFVRSEISMGVLKVDEMGRSGRDPMPII